MLAVAGVEWAMIPATAPVKTTAVSFSPWLGADVLGRAPSAAPPACAIAWPVVVAKKTAQIIFFILGPALPGSTVRIIVRSPVRRDARRLCGASLL